MNIEFTSIPGVYVVTLLPKVDERGYFMRAYDRAMFESRGLQVEWSQENQSLSTKRGTVRGLHFQRGNSSETKLVRVLSGSIMDVAVDLRRHSPTYGKSVSVILSKDNHKALYIPKGCAHGYFTLEDDSVVAYKVDSYYAPEAEGGIFWNDQSLGIPWPQDIQVSSLSEKDAHWPMFGEIEPIDAPIK
jgi:dTDP-4-dehydrorhamnose 3,5-epimerase